MDDMDGMDDMDMMMQMTYYWGTQVTVLWDFWNTNGDTFYYVITLIILFFFAVLSEGWSALAAQFRAQTNRHMMKQLLSKQENNIQSSGPKKFIGTPIDNLHYLKGAFFYTTKLILGYQLMLAVMTYNYGVSIAIFSGAFIGNFFFARFSETLTASEAKEVDEIACHL